jgi:anti-anti-sigma factor
MQHLPDTASFGLARTDDPPGLAVRGDLGAEHTARFARALRAAAADVTGNVYLDCEGLDTVSVEGLRAMMDAAAELSRFGRSLTVRRLSPYFLRIFRLAGWDQTPGLVFEALAATDPGRAQRPGPRGAVA